MTAGRQVDSGAGARLAHQPGLDGVRALAVVAVLAYHDGRLRGGFLGVSTFFTLSGFLITGLLLAEWHTHGRVSFRDFYARRLRRLMPVAVLGLVLAAAITPALREPSVSHAFRGDAFSALFDVANWRFLATGRSYAALFTAPSPVLHFWSLAVEEQFYLVLVPLLVGLLVLARGRRWLVAAMVAMLAVASFVDGWVAASGGSVDRAYYGTDTRAVEFLVGALLALAFARYRTGDAQLSRGASRVAAGLGLPALAFLAWMNTWAQPQDASLFRGGLLVYALAGAALLVAVCEPGPLRWFCSRAPLRGLGLISYGVYVLHWPLFLWLSPARTGLSPAPLTALRLGTTIALATISYRYIESPIRNRRWTVGGWKLDRRPWAIATAGVMAVAVASVAVAATEPALAVDFAPVRSQAAALAGAGAAVPVATRTAKGSSPKLERIVVTGDSVGLTLGRGIERWGASKGIAVLNAGSLGCTLLGGDLARTYSGVSVHPSDPCGTHETWPVVLRKFRPDLVVALFGAWDVYDLSWDGGKTWSAAGQAVFDAHYLATMRDASTRLAAYGAHVLWLAPPCFAWQQGDEGSPASPWYDPRRVAALGEMLHTVARETHASWSDVVQRAGCPVNFATRPDGVHYSDAGADAVMPALGPVIMRAGGADG